MSGGGAKGGAQRIPSGLHVDAFGTDNSYLDTGLKPTGCELMT